MACYQFWDAPGHVGSHHFAKAYARAGWKVYFLSSPISPLHFLRPTASLLKPRLANYQAGGHDYLDGALRAYVPGAILPPSRMPLLRSYQVYKNWWRFTAPSVLQKIKAAGFGSVDLIHFDNPQYLFLLDKIEHTHSIYRIADKHSGFPGYAESLDLLEKQLAQRVDLVVYTATKLRDHVESLHPKRSMHLPNGVDFSHFSKGSDLMPKDLEKVPGPRVIYVGALEDWFDFECVQSLADKHPELSFVLIGPDHLAKLRLKGRNIHLLGPKPFQTLPAYLKNADVGIIPFDVKKYPELIHAVNPLKLYEYMASGLQVVSTEWDELKHLESPALLAKTTNEFSEKLMTALQQKNESANVIGYAKNHDWLSRVAKMMTELNIKNVA